MIKRLRPLPSQEVLREMYPTPHDHMMYGQGHGERVTETIRLAKAHLPASLTSIADLSCGNAAIALALAAPHTTLHLGDYAVLPIELAPAHPKYCGALEDTLALIPHVDVFICSETLEHLDAPARVLERVWDCAQWMLISTPLECWDDGNTEHLWAWDRAGVELLLHHAGWRIAGFSTIDSREYGEPYLYGIWVVCK